MRNVMKKKHLEYQLRLREFALHQVQDAVYLIDAEQHFAFVNEAACRVLGYSREELLGITPCDIDTGYTHELFQAVQQEMLTESRFILERLHRRRNGSVFPVEAQMSAFEYQGQTVVMVLARDISERKQAEHSTATRELELEKSRSQLRGLIARREEVLEIERKRIAREVHDELGQILTGLHMNVSRLARKYANNSPGLREHVQETMTLAEKALGVARNVASALRPAVLDMGIAVALEWLAGRFGSNTGIRCHIHIADDDIQVDENQAIALYRITQESLTNVARHAKADRVDISLGKNATDYVLKIRDNGEGFDGAVRKVGSFGLVGIRERAFILGGTVDIDSGLDRGTEIRVHIPSHGIKENL
jgi:PAS domain S-box-containing protein